MDPANPNHPKPLISLCMIVRNEERCLARCLESAQPWVDDMVVVDTGSTDGTMAIAREHGALVVEHIWQDDFAQARNVSLEHARGQWILMLDADEELDQATAIHLRPAVEDSQHNGLMLELLNLMPGAARGLLPTPRLFRNHIGVRYQGVIHEEPMGIEPVGATPVRILHHGYNLDAQDSQAKHAQRLAMLQAWVEREPDSVAAHIYLAQRLNAQGEAPALALEHGLEALRLAQAQSKSQHHLARIYRAICFGLAGLGRFDEVLEYAREFQAHAPQHPDGYFLELGALVELDQPQEIVRASGEFLGCLERLTSSPDAMGLGEVVSVEQAPLAMHSRIVALARLGQNIEARADFARLLELGAGQDAVRDLLAALARQGLADLAKSLARMAAERFS